MIYSAFLECSQLLYRYMQDWEFSWYFFWFNAAFLLILFLLLLKELQVSPTWKFDSDSENSENLLI